MFARHVDFTFDVIVPLENVTVCESTRLVKNTPFCPVGIGWLSKLFVLSLSVTVVPEGDDDGTVAPPVKLAYFGIVTVPPFAGSATFFVAGGAFEVHAASNENGTSSKLATKSG